MRCSLRICAGTFSVSYIFINAIVKAFNFNIALYADDINLDISK